MEFISEKLQAYSVKISHYLKTSKMGFISVKLPVYSVQVAHYFQKLFQKVVFLKEHFSKSLWCSIIVIECSAHPALLH